MIAQASPKLVVKDTKNVSISLRLTETSKYLVFQVFSCMVGLLQYLAYQSFNDHLATELLVVNTVS